MEKLASAISLSRNEKIKIAVIFSVLLTITAMGFSAAFLIGKIAVVLGGLGIVAYVFGLRHGVDADHIAAIDNTTRKLMQEGKRPYTVGMWFSLGHSTIVVALIVALVLATRTVEINIPTLQNTGAVVGTLVSGSFLWIIGFINAVIVIGIYKIFQIKAGQTQPRGTRQPASKPRLHEPFLSSSLQSYKRTLAHLPSWLTLRLRLRHSK